ncbi:hypothetical protein HID58_013676, partial [Brassica napus]
MTNGFDLVLGSSSIGTMVHSRHRVENEVCESMDSSSSSLDLTAEIEELRNATAGEALRPPGGDRLWPVGPLSRKLQTGEGNVSHLDYSSGIDTIEQLLELPLERREVSFLVSDEALDRCSIRGMISGSRGNEALAEYKKALEAMSARKAAVKRIALVEDEEVQFVGSCRRRMAATNRFRASGYVPRTPFPASFDWPAVLSNLNVKVFPLVPARL